jgi:hypothetical protein
MANAIKEFFLILLIFSKVILRPIEILLAYFYGWFNLVSVVFYNVSCGYCFAGGADKKANRRILLIIIRTY